MKAKLTILFVILTYINLSAQTDYILRFVNNNPPFCSASIVVFSDSTYLYETGCENRSHINFGKWESTINQYKLTPINKSEFEVLDSIYVDSTLFSNNNDSLISFIFLDNAFSLIKNINVIAVEDSSFIKTEGSDNFVPSKKGKLLKEIYCNDDGEYFISKNEKGMLFLPGLSKLLGKDVFINLTEGVNNQIIKLNLPFDIFFFDRNPEWIDLKSEYIYKSIFFDK
jgi:hypothetical protein